MLARSRCCCGEAASLPCFPCGIPERTLTLSWTANGGGSVPLAWNGSTSGFSATWTNGSVNLTVTPPASVTLSCSSGILSFQISQFLVSFGTVVTCILSRQADGTCDPFHQHYKPPVGGVNAECNQLNASGYLDFYIDG